MNRVYIGFDPREELAYNTAQASILRRVNGPISIVPIKLKKVKGHLTRPIEYKDGKLWCPISEAPMATEFAISRFTVPFLAKKGWAAFLDCDVICLEDINNLFALADPKYAIMCVKHNQDSGAATKMDGQVQLFYARKNWSSVMLWNCDHPANKRFTKENLNSWPGRDLHAFKWLDDSEIGSLPQKWNWLVHVTPGKPKLEGIWHYTLGGPWFPNWPAVDSPNSKMFDDVWRKESVLEKSEYVPPTL